MKMENENNQQSIEQNAQVLSNNLNHVKSFDKPNLCSNDKTSKVKTSVDDYVCNEKNNISSSSKDESTQTDNFYDEDEEEDLKQEEIIIKYLLNERNKKDN